MEDSEKSLWCAVLNQAITDAIMRPRPRMVPDAGALRRTARHMVLKANKNGRVGKNGKLDKAVMMAAINELLLAEPKTVASCAVERSMLQILKLRDEARAWLINDSKDFREVCFLAGMDPDGVRDKARSLNRRNWVLDDRTRKSLTQIRPETPPLA